ncbi:MAG: type II toxin-antitoxin system RelE/ParE family toxin [Methylacidiphilaceae bacterium]|nr:type II toxin-antitoxin system RelE/ParE family toxin [Candidatus Methylacidiphilaceae bacterium]
MSKPFQIVFSKASLGEIAALPKDIQLQVLAEFEVLPRELEGGSSEKLGTLEREGRQLRRFRCRDYRIYFAVQESGVQVFRILHKNTLADFLFRSNLPLAEDEELEKSAAFWRMIDGREP